jgi:UDP-N-acetyl-2-amino-2-deoxyglucuronate dehydrogenase
MTTEFRFGIIGCGVISHTHAEEINNIKGAKLVAVADVVEDCAKSVGQAYGVDWYSDYLDLLKREDIDIVNILTPSGLRADIAIEAARHGKHVIAEKPIDVTYEKATAMIEACREAGVKLAVISQHRFDASTVKVKRVIEDGQFGHMVLGEYAVNWYRTQGYYDSGAWRGTWAMDGGGALMNQSIHTIDLLQYLVGPVESVFAHTATLAHERIEVEDVAVATVKFKSGALGTIVGTTSAYPGLSSRLEIFGTAGSAVIEHDRLTHLFLKSAEQEGQSANLAANALDTPDPTTVFGYAHRLQIEDMMNAIRDGREPLVNGEEGLKPLEIILAIYESAKTGKEVTLPLKKAETTH